MNLIKTEIPDLVLIQPDIYPDERGYFFESYQKKKFMDLGIVTQFIQDNESMSVKNVLRGLHFQVPPFAQAKLVRVARGSAQDIAVDLRRGSPTYGKWFSVVLSTSEKNLLFIPEGFAHGFLTLEDNTVFQYKCSNYYSRESEGSIIWNDPILNIDWMSKGPLVSGKDLDAMPFADFKTPFIYSGTPS